MRQWKDDIDDVTALYPAFAAWESKPYGHYIGSVTDTATVPASPYRLVLNFRPVRGKLGITLNAGAASLIEWGQTPTTGQVAVDYIGGNVEFAAADTGKTAVATFAEHYGSVLSAADWMQVQKEIEAVQAGAAQVVTVAKSGGDYATVQAAVDSITDSSASKPYLIAVYPGVHVGQTNITGKTHITIMGVGQPEDCILSYSAATDAMMSGVVNYPMGAGYCTLANLTVENTFTITGAMEATSAVTVGSLEGGDDFPSMAFRNCIMRANGRDAFFWRGCGSLLLTDCDLYGLSHTPAIDTAPTGEAGAGSTLTAVVRRCRVTTTYAPNWIGTADDDTLTLEISDCRITANAGEAMMYLVGSGTETITVNNCRGVGLYLYQTPAGHTGATTIKHAGIAATAGDRTGALVGTVTLSPLEQRTISTSEIVIGATPEIGSLDTGNGVNLRASSDGAEDNLTFLLDVHTDESAENVSNIGVMINGSTTKHLRFDLGSSKWVSSHLISAPQFDSSVAQGTAPLTVASTTKVANLNADLLDDLSSAAFVQHAVADAKGDILAATGADAFARVAAGTEGQVLSSNAAASAGVAYIWVPRFVGAITADSTTLASNNGQQYFDQTITVPAGYLRAGAVLRVRASGKHSTSTVRNTYLCLFGGSAGTTALCDNAIGFGYASMTDKGFSLNGDLTVREVGAAAAFRSSFEYHIWSFFYTARAAGTIDTTADNVLRIGFKTTASDAAHTATLEQFRVDVS